MTKNELIGFCRNEFEALMGVAERLGGLAPEGKRQFETNETAAMAAFLFSAYSGMERILEQVLLFDAISVKEGEENRHAELLRKAFELGILPQELYASISRYLAFREFFGRSYPTGLDPLKLGELAQGCGELVKALEKEVFEYIETI